MPNKIVIKDLAVAFGCQTVIDGISFELEDHEIGCIMGPSGCGKTTLLRTIAGFESRDSGEIWINGSLLSRSSGSISGDQLQVGMVFQDFALFPHMTVSENITFGLWKYSEKAKRDRLGELTELLELEDCAKQYPHQLSGGQQQRVALARSVAPTPDILLLDEPFSSLDIELREQLANQVRTILKKERITTLMVNHNQLEAFAIPIV